MNVNLNNNLNISSSKQESAKRVNENKEGSFEKSMMDSINSINENKVLGGSISKLNKIEINLNGDQILSEDDLENLEAIVYLLNLICNENNINDKIFNFENNNRNLFENEIDNVFMNHNRSDTKNDFSIDNKLLNKFLPELGLDENEFELENITKGELYKNILDNSDKFKNIIKKETSKISRDIPKLLDSLDNFLDDRELLKNIRNEINDKINKSIGKDNNNFENGEIDVKNQEVNNAKYEKLKIFTNVIDEKSNDNEILKKISGENSFDKNIESYFVDNLRNDDFSNNLSVKTIEFKNQEKFMKDFIETIKYMTTNNKSEMIIKINPDHLGKMDIKYEFVKDSIKVMIRVESSETLKVIENKIVDIKEIIRDHNQINLSNINVELKQFDFNSNHSSKHGGGKNNNNKNKNSIKLEDEGIVKEKNDLRSGILV